MRVMTVQTPELRMNKKHHEVLLVIVNPEKSEHKSVANTHKKTVASDTTNQNTRVTIRSCMRYNSGMEMIVQLILSLLTLDAQCNEGNLKLLCILWRKFLGFYCFVRDLQGNDLLTSISPTHAWLWLSKAFSSELRLHPLLSKKEVVTGLPKLKYVRDQLCSSCEMSKAKRSSFKTKAVPSSKGRLNLLHMDLCGPMRVASINGKKYILVIVDDYSRYTWTLFLRSKDETPEVLKDFLTMIQRNLQAQVITVRTDRGTEFLNKTLHAYFHRRRH
ncbi:retrovirus-related pol polyprotein from transposon TNT 1-94 [Tanacetum coccineum]